MTRTLTHQRTHPPSRSSRLPRIGRGLLTSFAVIVALVTALPVVLLFFITAVPVWLSALVALLDIGLIYGLLRFARTPALVGGGIVALVLVSALAVGLSQWFAATPPITDTDGNPVPGSIATLEQVELNGSRQWITVRGHSTDLPVLLFLAGGPGGSELAMTRKYLSELEKHFIVVNWDQPGTGKSYWAADFATITPGDYAADAHALTLHLRERFGVDKIYLFGESWGSIPGVWLAQQYPDHYHALVTTGQMVAPVANDIEMYEFALERLTAAGNLEAAERLRRNGPPPYPVEDLLGKFMAMNGPVHNYMMAHAHGEGTGHNLMLDSLVAPEYGLLDKVTWLVGLSRTFTTVYSQLDDVDFRTQATALEVPVYILKGRWDLNASNALAQEYFALVDAPYKEWVWFEDSQHTPSWDEPVHFTEVMVNTVLAQTAPSTPDN